METVSGIRSNGSGFVHAQRSLRPGETIPRPPSLADQLLACRHIRCMEQEIVEPVEEEDSDDDI